MGIRDWWQKLSGSASAGQGVVGETVDEPETPEGSTRHVRALTLGGGLTVHEYRHVYETQEGRQRMRTFLTEGLVMHGAHEVRLTVPASWSESSVEAALEVLAIQGKFAAEGRAAVLGGFTGLRPRGGDARLLGITYARGTPIDGIDGSEAALVAVRLHEDELALAQKGLTTRVLGALAERARFFPYPPWWEVRTSPVLGPRDQEHSMLEKIRPWIAVGDVHLTRVDETLLRLSLPREAARAFAEWRQHPEAEAVTILTTLAPDADGQMIWKPGATEPMATAIHDAVPRRMGYAFVSLLRVDANDVRLIEDGVALMLAAEAFDQVREALAAGRDLTLPVETETTLRVEFRPEAPDSN